MRSERKLDHIRHALTHSEGPVHYFDEVKVVHRSLPRLDWEELDLTAHIGELTSSSPLFVNAMTGGGGIKTEEINKGLARVAAQKGIGMAVGSQMAALKDRAERKTYEVVRRENPEGIVFSNVGSEAVFSEAKEAVDMLEADALQIHLNIVQELVMPEGDRDFSKRMENIQEILLKSEVPVIIKEVGFGLSGETIRDLEKMGCMYVDVGGKGGTNFSKVENERRANVMEGFDDWGIPTPVSILESSSIPHVFASGGIRSGIDGAKALILGAEAFGMAGPLLKAFMNGGEEVVGAKIDLIHEEVKSVMMVMNAVTLKDLHPQPYVLTGETKEWRTQRSEKL